MFTLERLKPEHFDEIIAQDSQKYFSELLLKHPEYKNIICQQSIGRVGRLDGDIIAICGITRITEYLGECWAYFSPDLPKRAIKIVKEIKKFLAKQKYIRRLYCTVDIYNTKAIRFAETLGFKPESILQSYGQDGHDHIMFTIINRNLDWEVK